MVAKTHVTIDCCRNNLQKVVTDDSSGERLRRAPVRPTKLR